MTTGEMFGLAWFGGKRRKRLNRWIVERLPDEYASYVEPYAGMLGVMMARRRSEVEIANDLNGRIVNWWEVVRDRGDELLDRLKWTLRHEKTFYEYRATMDEGDALERALKFHLVVACSVMHTDNDCTGFQWRTGSGAYRSPPFQPEPDAFDRLRRRVRRVTFLHRKAEDVLERFAGESFAVLYCDPPYADADTSVYTVVEGDHDRLVELYQAQTGKVAISGYGSEWDDLGWQRHEFETTFTDGTKGKPGDARTEVLWTNYQPPSRLLI